MQLDRTINHDGTGKYWLILNRVRAAASVSARREIDDALNVLAEHGVLDTGDDPRSEFFVIRLRDAFATKALEAYSWEAEQAATALDSDSLREYAAAVQDLADKAATHPAKHQPD